MNQLKLIGYFVESFRGEFPKFLSRYEEKKINQQLSRNISLYLSKKSKKNFAIKMEVKSITKTKNSRDPRIRFEATMVGFFRCIEGETSVKLLAKTVARDMLYEKMYLLFSSVLSNSPIKNFKLPLKFK
jgi:hypothetical protein